MKEKKRYTILFFFGTRPEAIKMAPVVERLKKEKRFRVRVAVSAQHRQMLDQVLAAFRLKSDIDLDLMRPNQSLYGLTARLLTEFEPVLNRVKPDLVLVHGDTTTTMGGSLASFYKQIPVGHVEAGLRTGDKYRPFPEEVNRRITDAVATLYFAPTSESRDNLRKEHIPEKSIFVTGNTVIDALLETVARPRPIIYPRVKRILDSLGKTGRLILMTAHRRENFGAPFEEVLSAVSEIAKRFPDVQWIYPVHPNPNVKEPAERRLGGFPNIHLLEPLEYTDLVRVMERSTLVVTDSGGLQEEAPSLGKPVIVLRDVTERPEAVRAGTVRLVGTDRRRIVSNVSRLLSDSRYYRRMANATNPYGDGRASDRIAGAIRWFFGIDKKRPEPFRET